MGRSLQIYGAIIPSGRGSNTAKAHSAAKKIAKKATKNKKGTGKAATFEQALRIAGLK